MQGTGNINYSIDKNDFHKILAGCISYYIPHYYLLIFISIIYIYTIKYKQYIFPNRKDEDAPHFFKSITYNIPFNILNISQDNNFIGLSSYSYIYIIVAYIITLIIILEGLIRNFLYSVYVNIIQLNSHNNPYNNPNNITKIKDSPYSSIIQNYTAILSLSINFLIPFLIPFIIYLLKFDNYDIKHNKWFSYVILYLIFFPFITVILSRAIFAQKLEIFSNLNRYIDVKDGNFIKFISNNFNFKIHSIIIFIFIIFVYSYYKLVYIDLNNTLIDKIKLYGILFILIFVFIPIVIVFFSLSLLFDNKNLSSGDVIHDINNKGISNIYNLLVKYNYPCFIK